MYMLIQVKKAQVGIFFGIEIFKLQPKSYIYDQNNFSLFIKRSYTHTCEL